MGSAGIAQYFVHDDLVGISKIEITFLEPDDGGNIERRPQLIVQEPIGKTGIVIIHKVIPFEFCVYVCHRSAIIFKILEENGRLYFKIVPTVLSEPIPGIGIIIPQGIGLKDRVELSEILVQNIGDIETEVKTAPPVQCAQIKIGIA